MTRKEAISYIHNHIKQASPEQLRDLICSIFSPRCSNTAPLRQTKNSGEIKLASFFDGNKLLQASQELLMVA